MPQVNDAGGKTAVLAARTTMYEPNEQVGIFTTPTVKACVEAVDALEIATPNREIAGTCTAPPRGTELAQSPERDRQHRSKSIGVASHRMPDPFCRCPRFRV